MVICPKCNAGNADKAVLCRECGEPIIKTALDGIKYVEKMEIERAEKLRKSIIAHYACTIIIGLIYLLFYILAILNGNFLIGTVVLLYPVLAYFAITQPDQLFYFNHRSVIANIYDAIPSDSYTIRTQIGGYILALIGLIRMIILAVA